MVETESKFLPKETSYAMAFARHAIGRKFVDLVSTVGVKSPKEAHKFDKWGNVARHGLLESMEADILAENLGLSKEMRRLLRVGAFLHDTYKREQITYLRRVEAGEDKLRMYDQSETLSRSSLDQGLRAIGLKEEDRGKIIETTDSVGYTSLRKTHDLLEKGWEDLSELEKAQIVMHVVDDMTGESKGQNHND